MEYKKLGNTDLEISRIGFGCWAIGGHGYGKVDDNESIKAIQKAVDLGINFFDTADVYGLGHSEEILSKALGVHRKKVIIATKFGVNWDKDGKTYKDSSPKRVFEAVEQSLKRLKVDCIPLYQIHWYDGKSSITDTIEALEKCKQAGKIRYIGCSNFTYDLLLKASEVYRLESLQCEFNLMQKKQESEIKKCYNTLKIGIIAYGVLARGIFSGKYNSESSFDINDTRGRDENFYGEKLKRNLIIVNELKRISSFYKKTPSNVAIRWVLDVPVITSAIIGMKTDKQVVENSSALDWYLEKKDWKYLSKIADISEEECKNFD